LTTMPKPLFDGVYLVDVEGYGQQLATVNIVPGTRSYGERLIKSEFGELRVWDPYRSKLAAAIKKGLRTMPITNGTSVLYLGAAAGTTVSHVSDIVGPRGLVYAVEFSARSIRELLVACENRKNVVPILADARRPMDYREYVDGVDVVYVDIAQPDQAEITVENTKVYLKRRGWVVLNIKARSVDVAVEPSKIYDQQKTVLTKSGFKIIEEVDLSPFEKDHDFIIAKMA
jgi:fibrillarin-like pre-rRNA processing protein